MLITVMKLLSGSDLAGFIKERQAHQVRSLVQSIKIYPKLAIVVANDNPVIDTYIKLKQKYGEDIGVKVEIHKIDQQDAKEEITQLNSDDSVHGIIVQLPLKNVDQTDEILGLVNPQKDVDGLAPNTKYDAATAMAINWLLAGHNINLKNQKICIVGHGKLVGAPLAKIWKASGLDIEVIDENTENKDLIILDSDIIVTAVGKPGLLRSDIVKHGATIVDAGVASEKGVLKGDTAEDVYDREDVKITPTKGGVGPLTVCALFDNVIRSAQLSLTNDA